MSADEESAAKKLALLKLADQLGSVTKACKIFEVSRDTFYRAKQAFKEHGPKGLENISRRKPNIKNRVAMQIEVAVIKLSLLRPSYGQVRIAKELAKQGMRISPAGVRCIWQRHGYETSQKRNAAKSQSVANDSHKH